MKISKLAVLPLLAAAAWADYTYYYTDPLTSINTTKWTQVGSVSATSNGLTATSSSGGSLISSVSAPTGNSYEVRMTLGLTVSGGTYAVLARASSGAQPGPSAAGTYYSFEMSPTFDGNGNCSATYLLKKRVSGVISQVASILGGCQNGMYMWLTVKPGELIVQVPYAGVYSWVYSDSDISAGQPGIAAYGTPAGNSITGAQLGPLDSTPPGNINQQSIGVASFSNRVELQWSGGIDDVNGIGLSSYTILRNGAWIGATPTPSWVDETVSPGQTYQYTMAAKDAHDNWSPQWTSPTTVITPAAGVTELRRVGSRPTGSYWGASGEQIDMWSGNLNFSVPLIKAMARGGWSATFALSYNSQMWRNDSGGTWLLGEDVGYGLGWKLQAGSVRAVWANNWNYASHCAST